MALSGEKSESERIAWRSLRVWRVYIFALIGCIVLLYVCTLPILVVYKAVGGDNTFLKYTSYAFSVLLISVVLELIRKNMNENDYSFYYLKSSFSEFLLIFIWALSVAGSVFFVLDESARVISVEPMHQPNVDGGIAFFGTIFAASLMCSYLQKISTTEGKGSNP